MCLLGRGRALDCKKSGAFFLPGQRKGGDTVAKKKTLQELEAEQARAERELKIAKQNEKILQSEIKRLTRNERTHRLCNHGGLLECFLPPDQYTDEQMEAILKILFPTPEAKALLERIRETKVTS